MPPALSDDETSDIETARPVRSLHNSASDDASDDAPVKSAKAANGHVDDEEDEDEGDEDEDEEEEGDLEENVFIVETIKKHMVDEDGTLKFLVKWEGYEKKSDMTWEPEDNLMESASDVLNAYFKEIGGRERIFEESREAARGKKRGRTSSATPGAAPKRSRKNGVHPGDSTPPATKEWSPPAGSWEDEIESIDACEDEGSGKLVVYLVWKNGRKTKHETSVIYKKCPQKMLLFYERHVRIIREENKALTE